MSDQISEKMARKIYDAACLAVELGGDGEDTFITNLRAAGLIKKSALDEAREWCLDTQNMATVYQVDVIQALQSLREKYEAAITEILEERE
jgi:hypothetical protein